MKHPLTPDTAVFWRTLLAGACLVLCSRAVAAERAPTPPGRLRSNIHRRSDLANARLRFEKDKAGHVAFIGGSITEMNGYRPMVCEVLQKRFPETKFTFTAAGISSTCSTTGAFRLGEHVLSKGPLDLFFVEFAVNDDQDAAHVHRQCIRGMEGIVRQVRKHNPRAEIVITYFVNPPMLELLQQGKTPVSIAAHEKVAEHYGVSTIHLAKEVADRIEAGSLTWKTYGGTHPKPPGNAICAAMIDELMTACWTKPLPDNAAGKPHALPAKPLDERSYGRGRFVDLSCAKVKAGWELGVPPWKSLPGSCRTRFVSAKMLSAEKPGAQLSLEFTGAAVGAYVLAGPDAGIVEASIDGGPFEKLDLFHRFSKGLHYPRTVIFADELADGKHTLVLRTTDQRNEASKGSAARILEFVAN